MNTTVLALTWKAVARIDSFEFTDPARPRRFTLTLMSPASFDEQGGYAPAESVSVTLFKADVEALIAALQAAVAPIPKEVTP